MQEPAQTQKLRGYEKNTSGSKLRSRVIVQKEKKNKLLGMQGGLQSQNGPLLTYIAIRQSPEVDHSRFAGTILLQGNQGRRKTST